MTHEEPVQVWVVAPDGRFLEQEPPSCPCECCEDDDEDPEVSSMIFEDDPDGICPVCQQPIKKGEVTLTLTRWDDAYDNQSEDYPLYGTSRLVHITCVTGGQDDKR